MLDHLKQLCERRLRELVCADTVDDLLQEVELCNARQLRDLCLHFARHHGAPRDRDRDLATMTFSHHCPLPSP